MIRHARWDGWLLLLALAGCKPDAQPTVSPTPTPAPAASAPTGEDAAESDALAEYIAAHYDKLEVRIPMRDGVKLFTTIYTPKDAAAPAPIMLKRTPYSVAPYGPDAMPTQLGPSETLARKGWIFVYQDVRGRFMSEGKFINMTPHVSDASEDAVDESTDTYDTIAWLVDNVDGHNGRVGQWGISYPGFYAAAGMVNAHPALRAVSPQAPIADWFFDDFHHHGAFFLPHAFNFLAVFGQKRRGPTTQWPPRFEHGTTDGYAFFRDLGPLRNANERYLDGEIAFWNAVTEHPNYDEFWKSRNLLPHLHDVAPAVMTVGGWFDAEDLYGPLHIYGAIEEKNPGVTNMLVMGPWPHGGWARTNGRRLGNVDFGADTSQYYQTKIEAPFFEHHLGNGPDPGLPEAHVFETGRNAWRTFDAWPPKTEPRVLYFGSEGALVSERPSSKRGSDSYVSDPEHPVPFSEDIATGMTREYMTDDQRFASRRPDVLTYQSEPLTEPLTIAGPLSAELFVSTTGRDADFVVKLIDVFPNDAVMPDEDGTVRPFSGYQMMVRSEVFRARFRNDYSAPRPMKLGAVETVTVPLQDVLHTFEPGHRVMIQVQSTWFPLVDINPQSWVENIFEAEDDDFIEATHTVHRSATHASGVTFGVLARP
ncbi:MAG: CocE/NonD family hydrolase [Nannocystaceae bacterium]|nr:CocE/NonD family hydrolase [bacterium]